MKIYREGVACCCHNAAINEKREGRQNKMDFALIQDLQGFLATFAPWRFQGFGSGLSGLGSCGWIKPHGIRQ
jgi:hypothetical protein